MASKTTTGNAPKWVCKHPGQEEATMPTANPCGYCKHPTNRVVRNVWASKRGAEPCIEYGPAIHECNACKPEDN